MASAGKKTEVPLFFVTRNGTLRDWWITSRDSKKFTVYSPEEIEDRDWFGTHRTLGEHNLYGQENLEEHYAKNPEQALMEAEEEPLDDREPSVRSRELEPLLDVLEPRDADLIYLRFVLLKPQADIGFILGLSQAAVSYAINRAMLRFRWKLEQGTYFTPEECFEAISKLPLEAPFSTRRKLEDIGRLCAEVWRYSNQTTACRVTGIGPSRIKYWLERFTLITIPKLAEKDPSWNRFKAGWERYWSHGMNLGAYLWDPARADAMKRKRSNSMLKVWQRKRSTGGVKLTRKR